MKFLLGLLLALATPVAALDVVTFDQPSYVGVVGATLEVRVMFEVTASDTIKFSRHALNYDETKLTLLSIENGADVPAYSLEPFVNWDGSGGADVVWLGQFFAVGGTEVPWMGEAQVLTFRLDATVNGSPLVWDETGVMVNYVDVNSGPCGVPNIRRYAKVCDATSVYQQCVGSGSPYGECVKQEQFLGATITIVEGLVAVEEHSWSTIKLLYGTP